MTRYYPGILVLILIFVILDFLVDIGVIKVG
jgi:hypothetical protein